MIVLVWVVNIYTYLIPRDNFSRNFGYGKDELGLIVKKKCTIYWLIEYLQILFNLLHLFPKIDFKNDICNVRYESIEPVAI